MEKNILYRRVLIRVRSKYASLTSVLIISCYNKSTLEYRHLVLDTQSYHNIRRTVLISCGREHVKLEHVEMCCDNA